MIKDFFPFLLDHEYISILYLENNMNGTIETSKREEGSNKGGWGLPASAREVWDPTCKRGTCLIRQAGGTGPRVKDLNDSTDPF